VCGTVGAVMVAEVVKLVTGLANLPADWLSSMRSTRRGGSCAFRLDP
jgi:hypothetical protein